MGIELVIFTASIFANQWFPHEITPTTIGIKQVQVRQYKQMYQQEADTKAILRELKKARNK